MIIIMKLYYIFRLIFFLFTVINIHPVFAQNQTVKMEALIGSHSKHIFGLQNDLRSSDKGEIKFDINYNLNNLSSKLAFNYNGYNKSNLDRSYIQYTKGIATFGIGAIDRQWSFSDKTSLILSHNARPTSSIYLKLENKFGYDWFQKKLIGLLKFLMG